MFRSNRKSRKGFSLVELVVVILIIAILAAAIFLGGATVINQARASQVKSDLRNLGTYVQDMMYENPELQYKADYKDQHFTFNTATGKFSGKVDATANADKATAAEAVDAAATGKVFKMLVDEYLTDDFQLGEVKDAWDNPYCFSYVQLASDASGKASSCAIVINSLGKNSRDESSDGTTEHAATVFKEGMKAEADYEKWASAELFVTDTANGLAKADATGDDYGVVVVMIDGEVSVAYYGF